MKNTLFCIAAAVLFSASAEDAVREVTNPRAYPNGDANRESVEAFFHSKVSPENYNLWLGKKDRLDLNGIWKICILDSPKDFSRKTFITSGLQTIKAGDFRYTESRYGEDHAFFCEHYDDSRWFHTIVPSPLRYRFKNGEISPRFPEAWYRKTFVIPEKWNGRRFVLKFEKVNDKAVIYVNGKKAGEHENARLSSWFLLGSGANEKFELDITKLVRTGRNQISVKAYSPVYARTGIIAPVWLDALPQVYADHISVTPNGEKKSLTLRAFFHNATGKNIKITPKAVLRPWKSTRYHLADWQEEAVGLSPRLIPPGNSEVSFEVPLKKIHWWSPDNPQLYHLLLLNSDDTLLGQERFGYRTVSVGKKCFLLNGIPFYLRGENIMLAAYQFPGEKEFFTNLDVLNAGNSIGRYLTEYKDTGYNLMRLHLTCAPDIYYDLADETGMTYYVEEIIDATRFAFKDGKWQMDSAQRRAIRNRTLNEYNHPSVILRAGYNEAYDFSSYGTRFSREGWTPILNEQHDEVKKWDAVRPWCASSGRTSSRHYGILNPSIRDAEGNFDDSHNYTGAVSQAFAEDDKALNSFPMDKQMYTLANKGCERAMLLGEFGNLMLSPRFPRVKKWIERVKPHLHNGAYDRTWLAKNADTLGERAPSIAASWAPFRVQATDRRQSDIMQGRHLKHLFEMLRRKRDSLAGYIVHSSQLVQFGPFGIQQEILPFVKMAQQKILAIADAYFPYNAVTGNRISSKIVLVNDSRKTVPASDVSVSVGGKPVAKLFCSSLAPGEREIRELDFIVPDLPTGKHSIEFSVRSAGNMISQNSYTGMFFNRSELKLNGIGRMPILLLEPDGTLENIFRILGLNYEISKNIPDGFRGVVAATGRLPVKTLERVVEAARNGQKVLLLELCDLPGNFPGRLVPPTSPENAELVLPSHPVFRGLDDNDFLLWNGNAGEKDARSVFIRGIYPLHSGALLMKQALNSRMAMVAGEFRYGKGRVFFSQAQAVRRFGTDGAATKYLRNLLDYVTANFGEPDTPLIEAASVRRTYEAAEGKKIFFVDLKPFANMGFTDGVAGDKKGGWSDQGPYPQDASFLKPGVLKAAGVPFELINEKKNNGKACVVLRGGPRTATDFLPLSVRRIPIGRNAKRLYFLLASKWTPKKERFGEIRINMNIQSGGIFQSHSIPLIGEDNIGDWWNGSSVPNALIAFQHSVSGITLSAYAVEWVNPESFVPVSSIDFISDGKIGFPILLGISGF